MCVSFFANLFRHFPRKGKWRPNAEQNRTKRLAAVVAKPQEEAAEGGIRWGGRRQTAKDRAVGASRLEKAAGVHSWDEEQPRRAGRQHGSREVLWFDGPRKRRSICQSSLTCGGANMQLITCTPYLIASSLATGETFPGAGVSHVVQSDQGPGDRSSHAKTPSSRLHCGKHTSHWRRNTGETHPPRRLLEGSVESPSWTWGACVLFLPQQLV